MSVEEAKSLKSEAEFEWFYAQHEAEREKRGDPSPEAIGLLEATEIVAFERAYRTP